MTETANPARNKTLLMVLGVVAALIIAAGIYAYRGGFDRGGPVANTDKVDPDVALLMAAGPLPDIVMGSADAPYT
ncbi:MAG: hypothetical protein WBE04_08375, partial [Methyloceanibacter sp.]